MPSIVSVGAKIDFIRDKENRITGFSLEEGIVKTWVHKIE
jgi:hypothetical protein